MGMSEDELREHLDEIERDANLVKKLLNADIDVEKEVITKTHSFEEKVMLLEPLLAHLNLSALAESENLRPFLSALNVEFEELRNTLEEKMSHELFFIEEEERLLQEIGEDLQHRFWQAAWSVAQTVVKEEGKELRADLTFMSKIRDMLAAMRKSVEQEQNIIVEDKRVKALDPEGLGALQELTGFIDVLYQFVSFYERAFAQMIEKEQKLFK